ncbi:MAG: formate/nitrite transporter family protein [Solirubrobacteraceae bacterium]
MADRTPEEIWDEGLDEGERRLARSWVALAATGFAGGTDVMFGIVAATVASAGLAAVMPPATAHVLGALLFGLGFVFITIGRAELFTENFLIPVGTVFAGRASMRELMRMWIITLALNFLALAIFGLIFSVKGVLPTGSLHTAGMNADTLADRSFLAALLSAVAAGVIMTVFTWITTAAESAVGRIVVALLVGFLLSAPTLNHAVVGFGEMFFGLVAGTTHATWPDLAANVGIAILGNTIGGVGLVFTTRLAQVGGDPADGSSESKARRGA